MSDAERAFIEEHTILGERILDGAPALRATARLVRASHERWDGSGYPDRLSGKEIPLGSRIVSVCDAYEAMTSDRPYRASMAHESACLELRRCSGTQFDPAVLDAFITVMQTRPDEREADRARQAAAHVRALLNGSSAPAPREAIRV